MINLFFQDNNKKYLKKINNFFKNDLWVNGKIVNKFEENIEKKLKLNLKACSCNSGSDALMLALKLDQHKTKDIYLTTPLSYIASSSIAKFLNLELIYIDVEKNNYLLDLNKLDSFLENCDKSILKRIKGVINVEIFGSTNDLFKLKRITKKHNLSLIGDCSQSLGTLFNGKSSLDYYDYSVVSFYPTKILSAYGDAGMIFVKKKLKTKTLLMKNNGHSNIDKKDCKLLGINSRMDSFQAYILDNKLKKLDKIISIKKKYADLLKKNLPKSFTSPAINSKVTPNNYLISFYIDPPKKKNFIKYMKRSNINCRTIYEKLLNENKVLKPIIKTNLDNAIKCKKSLITVPCHENLSEKQFKFIIKKIKEFEFKFN
jgi:dTDP-4-amino-4,6-dideoxygalactose transaminase